MHLLPRYYKISLIESTLQWNLEDAEKLKEGGTSKIYSPKIGKTCDISEYIDDHKVKINQLQNKEDDLTSHLKPIILIHQFGLVLGIIVLAISRAYETIVFVLCT